MPIDNEPNILLVEDNPIDVRLIKLALRMGGFEKEPDVVDDGIPAIDLLRRTHTEGSFPQMVILDLNLKLLDGPEVLSFIRNDPGLANLFVAILSSSPEDVMIRRAAGANSYLSKPSDLDSYRRLGNEIASSYCRWRLA